MWEPARPSSAGKARETAVGRLRGPPGPCQGRARRRRSPCDDRRSLPSLAALPRSRGLPFVVTDTGQPELEGEPVPTSSGDGRTQEQEGTRQGLEKQLHGLREVDAGLVDQPGSGRPWPMG